MNDDNYNRQDKSDKFKKQKAIAILALGAGVAAIGYSKYGQTLPTGDS